MRAIRRLSVLVPGVLGVLVALAAAGCADPSLEPEADELRSELHDLPGVASVDLDYTAPITLDSGKVAVTVRMDRDAGTDRVAEVVETAYDAFRGTHHGEEADLALRVGRSSVALRSFEPEAEVAAVGDAVRTGLAAAPAGGSVAIDLTTQRVPRGDHVAGTYVVTLPPGSTGTDVPAFLTELAAEHADDPLIGWGAAAADGSALTYDHGFPPTDLVAHWERIQAAGPPLAVRAVEDGALFATGRPAAQRDVRPQLRALGDGPWTYDLSGPGGRRLASLDRYLCLTTSEGPYDDRLDAWVERELGPCDPP